MFFQCLTLCSWHKNNLFLKFSNSKFWPRGLLFTRMVVYCNLSERSSCHISCDVIMLPQCVPPFFPFWTITATFHSLLPLYHILFSKHLGQYDRHPQYLSNRENIFIAITDTYHARPGQPASFSWSLRTISIKYWAAGRHHMKWKDRSL